MLCEGQVIKANHNHILGNPYPQFIQSQECSERAFIASTKDRVRPKAVLHHFQHHPNRGIRVEICLKNQVRIVIYPVFRKGREVPLFAPV